MLAHEWLRSHLRGPDALEPQRGPHLAVALAMKRTLLKDLTSVMHRLFIAAGGRSAGARSNLVGAGRADLARARHLPQPCIPALGHTVCWRILMHGGSPLRVPSSEGVHSGPPS